MRVTCTGDVVGGGRRSIRRISDSDRAATGRARAAGHRRGEGRPRMATERGCARDVPFLARGRIPAAIRYPRTTDGCRDEFVIGMTLGEAAERTRVIPSICRADRCNVPFSLNSLRHDDRSPVEARRSRIAASAIWPATEDADGDDDGDGAGVPAGSKRQKRRLPPFRAVLAARQRR